MSTFLDELENRGFGLLPGAVELSTVERLRQLCRDALSDTGDTRRARSSRGHVYAARNLLDAIPEVKTFWRGGAIAATLREVLGTRFGMVRVLFLTSRPIAAGPSHGTRTRRSPSRTVMPCHPQIFRGRRSRPESRM